MGPLRSSVTGPKIVVAMGGGEVQMVLQPRGPNDHLSGALVANTLSTSKHTAYYRLEIFGDHLVRLPLDPPLVHDGVFFYCGGASFPLPAAYASSTAGEIPIRVFLA